MEGDEKGSSNIGMELMVMMKINFFYIFYHELFCYVCC